ncbi:MAG: AEC family transporter [Eubacteriales bacterium]|nr:AEC family transporter [Eubacteriales bacterium]
MAANFGTVVQQVIILTILIATGFFSRKVKLIDKNSLSTMTNLTVYVAVPCMLIRAFSMEFSPDMIVGFFLEMLISLVIHAFGAAVGFVVFRKAPEMRKRMYICCLALGNVGFMGFPLLQAIYGNVGLYYGSAYNFTFNVLLWGVGLGYLNDENDKFDIIEVLKNPSISSAFVGFIIFVTSFKIPTVIDNGMAYLAGLAVPLSLMVIGARLVELDIKLLIYDVRFWICTVLRLLIVPAIVAVILHVIGLRGVILEVAVILAATPPASLLGMVAGKKDPETGALTAGTVSGQTALSMLTIPVVALIAAAMA